MESRGYQNIKFISSGGYGSVYMVEKNKTRYAIKTMFYEYKDDGAPQLNELDIMTRFNQPNLMKAVDFFFDMDTQKELNKTTGIRGKEQIISLSIVMELADYDLVTYMKNNQPSMNEAKRLMYEITSGLIFLHRNKITHNDLKPPNILIRNGRAIISDFGLSVNVELKPQNIITINYAPPEVIQLGHGWKLMDDYDPTEIDYYAADIWSLGCIYAYILIGHNLFPFDNLTEHILEYLNYPEQYFLDNYVPTEWIPLLTQMLSLDVNKRPKSATDIFSYNVFKSSGYDSIIDGFVIENPMSPNVSCDKKISILTSWLFDLASDVGGGVSNKDLFLGFDLLYRCFDNFIKGKEDNGKIQLLGTTCLYIASKLGRLSSISISEFVYLTDNTYTIDQVVAMEQEIITYLKGMVATNNLYDYAFSQQALVKCLPILLDCDLYKQINFKTIMTEFQMAETNWERENRKSKVGDFRRIRRKFLLEIRSFEKMSGFVVTEDIMDETYLDRYRRYQQATISTT